MKLPKPGTIILLFAAMSLAACIGFPSPVPVYAQTPAVCAMNPPLSSDMPTFENRYVTQHFVLKWTNRSDDPKDNISDPEIIKQTAGYFEYAWTKYMALFGKAPYTAPCHKRIRVVFSDLGDYYGAADPPAGPIQLNAYAWVHDPAIRKPTSAHELFHKLQYAFGYRTQWIPREPYTWFIEGTAAWSEAYVWGRVSSSSKVVNIFENTNMDLYTASYDAMPFWVYFVHGNQGHPNNHLMAELLQKCEQLHNVRLALNDVIKEAYGSVNAFYLGFARERENGFWSKTCSTPYNCILGPRGHDLVSEIRNIQAENNQD